MDGIRALIDNRLSYMVMLAADNELLNGDGTGVHINGFYNQITQAQAKGADPVFDAIFKGMNLVRTTGFANPDTVVLHPLDFVDIRLTRTADGLYIMGEPTEPGAETLFGLQVVQTTAALQNTGLVGDFATHCAMITGWAWTCRRPTPTTRISSRTSGPSRRGCGWGWQFIVSRPLPRSLGYNYLLIPERTRRRCPSLNPRCPRGPSCSQGFPAPAPVQCRR